jgi:hypothetical protein
LPEWSIPTSSGTVYDCQGGDGANNQEQPGGFLYLEEIRENLVYLLFPYCLIDEYTDLHQPMQFSKPFFLIPYRISGNLPIGILKLLRGQLLYLSNPE